MSMYSPLFLTRSTATELQSVFPQARIAHTLVGQARPWEMVYVGRMTEIEIQGQSPPPPRVCGAAAPISGGIQFHCPCHCVPTEALCSRGPCVVLVCTVWYTAVCSSAVFVLFRMNSGPCLKKSIPGLVQKRQKDGQPCDSQQHAVGSGCSRKPLLSLTVGGRGASARTGRPRGFR